MSSVWPTKAEIVERQRLALEAWNRAATLGDGWPRRRDYQAAMPYHGTPPGRTLGVTVLWCPTYGQYYISTPYARTLVPTIAAVDEVIRMEAEHPGWLEEMLTGKNSVRELEEAQDRARERYKQTDGKAADAILDMF